MGLGPKRLVNTGLKGRSNWHLLPAFACCWKVQATLRINLLWNSIICPQNTYPEGRRAENRQTGLILWDQSHSIKWGTDTNLNPKDLPEMIRWKGIGLEQPFSSLPLILWPFPSMWVMLALGSSLSFCSVCSRQLVQQERSRVPSLWDSWRSQCQDGEWCIELSFSPDFHRGVLCSLPSVPGTQTFQHAHWVPRHYAVKKKWGRRHKLGQTLKNTGTVSLSHTRLSGPTVTGKSGACQKAVGWLWD